MDKKEFAERLKSLRESYSTGRCDKGKTISRSVIAQLCGLSVNAISQYERAEKLPDAESLVKISDFYGVSVDYLLKGDKKSYK